MAREINLVPDIKDEMIKTLKLRNFIFFLCIVVAAASIGVTALAGIIVAGQDLAIKGKNDTIETLSNKLNSYKDLNEFLTIKDQVGNISSLTSNKKVFSRTFDLLGVMLPSESDPDSIKISELRVDLEDEVPTLNIDAQADSGTAPFIDYNVLDSFKKSMQYLKFDYGNYVDRYGNAIPSYCMIETNAEGTTFKDEQNGYYAYWTINNEGCDPAAESSEGDEPINNEGNYTFEDYNGQQVVRIWRTPQFKDWYKEQASEDGAIMTRDGVISNVAHFNSSCIKYKVEFQGDTATKLDDSENECKLVPNATGEDGAGISIKESSNGRDSSGNLVLVFSANIELNPDIFNFTNLHFLALPPSGRFNVTDSYVQIQNMFSERASECAADDVDCNAANENDKKRENANNTAGGNN